MKNLYILVFALFIFSCSEKAGEADQQLLWNCLDQDLSKMGKDTALLNKGNALVSAARKDGYKEFGQGFVALTKKDSAGARKTFHHMIKEKHTRWLGYSGLGLAAWQTKHYTLARACYDSALARAENQPLIWYLKGLNEAELDTSGRYTEAIRCFETAGKMQEKFYYAWYMAGLYHYMGDSTSRGLKKAIPFMEKAIAVNPKNPDAYIFLADNCDSYHERLHYTQLAIDAGDIPSIKKMAMLRISFGDYKTALVYFDQYLTLVNNNPEDHIAKASCLMAMGKYSEALEALSYARALDPSPAGNHIHYRKSLILFDQGKYADALKEINVVLNLKTYEEAEFYVHKARILMAMNQKAQARAVLDQYLTAVEGSETDASAAENMRAFYWN